VKRCLFIDDDDDDEGSELVRVTVNCFEAAHWLLLKVFRRRLPVRT